MADHPVPNAAFIHAIRIPVPVFNAVAPAPRWVRLPDLEVPDGMYLLVKAWSVNPPLSLVYVAETPANAVNVDLAWPLMPNEVVRWKVKNAEALYVSATVAACWVTISAEQRS